METISGFPSHARRNVLFVVLAALAIMVFSAVVFRVENPSIVQHEEERRMPGGEGKEKMGGMGDMGGVAELMARLKEHPDDTETMQSLGMLFMDMQAWDKSISFWDMLLQRNATDVMAMNQKGICLFELKKHGEAAEQFERMLQSEPENVHAHFNLGILYKHFLSQPDKATPHFKKVVDSGSDDRELIDNAKEELKGE